jgi:phage baseplate assembly protein W
VSDNIRDREYIGQGLAFPLQYDPRGGIALAGGERDIEQAIRIILETVPGERVMRPEFGCRIHDLIFAPYDATTQGLMIRFVEQALERWEPRVAVREVNVSVPASQDGPYQDGAVQIEIRYEIKDTHDERSIIHPFYLTGEQEAM